MRYKILLSLFVLSVLTVPVGAQQTSSSFLTVGKVAPDFTLSDVYTGKKRTLSQFAQSKRPVVLFFFCGCSACHVVASEWAKYQRANALPSNAATVIVYSTTDKTEVLERVKSTGLERKRTAVLCDTEDLAITSQLYNAQPCPRVLVLDTQGRLCYTNLGTNDNWQNSESASELEHQAILLTTRALASLESASTQTTTGGKP